MRMCAVCDLPIQRGDARSFFADEPIHAYCDVSRRGENPCANTRCEWRWIVHGGACVA